MCVCVFCAILAMVKCSTGREGCHSSVCKLMANNMALASCYNLINDRQCCSSSVCPGIVIVITK